MTKKKEVVLPSLSGVGFPTDVGTIPVTYVEGGLPITVFVGGLHISDVKSSEYTDACVHEALAKHAIKTVQEIVDCWNDYRNNIISNYQNSAKG